MSPAAAQMRELLSEAGPDTVSGGILAWWGRTDFPDGDANVPPLGQQQWEGLYFLLENAALERGVVKPLPAVTALTKDLRPDGPLPIAIASFRLGVLRPELAPDLASAVEARHAFMASGLLYDQWGLATPVYRGRHVTFVVDEAFHFTNPDGLLPDSIEADPGDGKGFRQVSFGEPFEADYPEGDSITVTIRCRYGQTTRAARFTVLISDRPAAPAPDETWPLAAPDGGNTGSAHVFRAPGHTGIRNPVILVEGFPGGRPYDYLYELLNAAGTLDGLLAAGYDMVLVGLDRGADQVQRNADVLIECIREASGRTSAPLVVGGVSLGGLVSRYALALLESRGESHNVQTYLSIDTPHGGAYTSLGVQWFVKSLLPFCPALGGFEALLDSPGNQQMMVSWLHDDGTPGISPLREQLLQDLEQAGGYPKQPRKLAVSCGRGDGLGNGTRGARTLTWDGDSLVSAALNTLPGEDGLVARGSWFLADPPELQPLMVDRDEVPWESVPGGQNTYNAQVAAIAAGFGCGTVQHAHDLTCSVPTVSALDLVQSPFEAVPPVSGNTGPFDTYVCSSQNMQHLAITPEVSAWLLAELGTPASGAGTPSSPGDDFDPAQFDPRNLRFLADPYPTYERFREEAPVSMVNPYKSYWVFRHEDVRRVLDEKDIFVKNSPLKTDPKPGPIRAMAFFPEGLFSSDPPRHDDLRAVLEPLFCDAIGQAPELASQIADTQLKKAAQTGRIELVSDYALPVPSGVLFSILGIPNDEMVWSGLVSWVTAIVAAHDITQTLSVQAAGATCMMALQTYLDGLIRWNLKDPQEGLIGAMCKHRLSPADIQACCADFVVAGYLSTTFLICTGIRNLLANPEQAQALRDSGQIGAAIQEMLRFDAPAQVVDRVVKTDTKLGDVTLKPGDKVTAVLGSADRDPAAFAEPEKFRIDRDNKAQMSFGAGIHHCIGAPLVEKVAPVALGKLLDLRDLTVAGLPQWQTDPYLRGMVNLPLSFTPA
jgi:cytochrome P450